MPYCSFINPYLDIEHPWAFCSRNNGFIIYIYVSLPQGTTLTFSHELGNGMPSYRLILRYGKLKRRTCEQKKGCDLMQPNKIGMLTQTWIIRVYIYVCIYLYTRTYTEFVLQPKRRYKSDPQNYSCLAAKIRHSPSSFSCWLNHQHVHVIAVIPSWYFIIGNTMKPSNPQIILRCFWDSN